MIPLFRCVTVGERPGPALRRGLDHAVRRAAVRLQGAKEGHRLGDAHKAAAELEALKSFEDGQGQEERTN